MVSINAFSNSSLLAKFQNTSVSSDLTTTVKLKNPQASDAANIADMAKPAIPLPVESLENLFRQFDGDKNSTLTKEELLKGLQSMGFSEDGSEAVANMVFSAENDINGDGLSFAELQRMQNWLPKTQPVLMLRIWIIAAKFQRKSWNKRLLFTANWAVNSMPNRRAMCSLPAI
jgi:hypothetical protein